MGRLILILMTGMMLIADGVSAAPIQREIGEGWRFRRARSENWYPATVPGVVHTDLMANGLLDDPFKGLDERAAQWVDKEDWVYQTAFDVAPEVLAQERVELVFYGLDTYADVYLNDERILTADNMFRTWRAEVKPLLRRTGNTLRVCFHSPIERAMPLWEADPMKYRASNDQSANGGLFDRKLSVFTRKAGYHYGWDWGPRLVTSGIWRPVVLRAWSGTRLTDVRFVQSGVSARRADVRVVAQVSAERAFPDATLRVVDEDTGRTLAESRVKLTPGDNEAEAAFTLRNPRLWWCNGMGDQPLYRFRTELILDGRRSDSCSRRIGIRSIETVRETDGEGVGFYFRLNGRRIFAKGVNYIPGDSFLPRMTGERYRRTVCDAAEAHMNMIRVWGGGIYEDDRFYDLCDEYGILVWQDFAFACSVYPAEGEFLESVRREAEDNVRRLRNHACLALWCGNNEIMDALFNWSADGGWLGDYRRQNPAWADRIWKQYRTLFHELLPEVVEAENPETFYLPTSPFSDEKGSRSEHVGDSHFWTVWQQGLPIAGFADVRSRFFSEYGYQSFPEYATVKAYATERRDEDIASEVMMWHQRGGTGANATIARNVAYQYGAARDFASFLYLSQLLQADAMRTAVEAHRRDMPHCMGSLYWQHNDCWPGASWSTCDYFGRCKAAYYSVRRAFEEVLLSARVHNDSLQIRAVSDRPERIEGEVTLRAVTFDGKPVEERRFAVRLAASENRICLEEPLETLLKGHSPREVAVSVTLRESDGRLWRSVLMLCRPAETTLPRDAVTWRIAPAEGGYRVEFEAAKFARGVFLTVEGDVCDVSDNGFDLMPGERRTVTVRSVLPPQDFSAALRVYTLADALQ